MNAVGVVGAGTMGQGIAQVCAAAGCRVLLFDVNPDQAARALQSINQNLFQAVSKGKLSAADRDATMLRIQSVGGLEQLQADLIIEAAVEHLETKQALFGKLEAINHGKAILTTNTSSLSVTSIAAKLNNPARLLGYHFFNPADKMKLVEIVSGKHTDPALVGALTAFSEDLGKIPVLAKDSPGFIVNRVARHFYVESLKVAEDGVAEVKAIDDLLRSAGFRMGPFELMDLIGVDVNLAVTRSVYEGFQRASRFKPSALQQKLVDEGNFGRKSGKGFYDYR